MPVEREIRKISGEIGEIVAKSRALTPWLINSRLFSRIKVDGVVRRPVVCFYIASVRMDAAVITYPEYPRDAEIELAAWALTTVVVMQVSAGTGRLVATIDGKDRCFSRQKSFTYQRFRFAAGIGGQSQRDRVILRI